MYKGKDPLQSKKNKKKNWGRENESGLLNEKYKKKNETR